MKELVFYEKTGCINNTKQKKVLSLANYEFTAVDIIKYNWTKDEILNFFSSLPVEKWFNTKSPRVKSGEIIPSKYSSEEALNLMLDDHLLIKRPLIKIEDSYLVGFDMDKIEEAMEVKKNSDSEEYKELIKQDLETCPQEKNNQPDCDSLK